MKENSLTKTHRLEEKIINNTCEYKLAKKSDQPPCPIRLYIANCGYKLAILEGYKRDEFAFPIVTELDIDFFSKDKKCWKCGKKIKLLQGYNDE